ncbi:MAG TPA: histidine kinase dimerization/phosphoacceptor domain -containing protein [Afifellaceae bacterium]|nr:histidine kinase dimerization/phosphoacceptor domain -containing protein [Afifellaceae bacterium]
MAGETREELEELLSQRTSLATFGELALKTEDLTEVLHEACRLVGEALGTDFAKVIELQDDGTRLLVRAGTGWQPGIVGQKVLAPEEDAATAYALQTGLPVAISDVEKDDRFSVADFVREHGVRALVNVNIIGQPGERPFGILEVDSREPRTFTDSDIDFLRTYANMIAAAVERMRIVATLRQRAHEKEQLLQELQHRTKNNLQVISSLVRLQSQRASHPQARDELQKITTRIESLRMLHDKLYSAGEVDRVDLGGYLVDFAGAVLRFHGELSAGIRLVADVEQVMVPTQSAVPVGLITNEFVTNSLKYAFDGRPGRIGIQVERPAGGAVCVRLWDDGKGMPTKPGSGTGMFLIDNLARQIASEVSWANQSGATLKLILRP